MHGNAKNWKLAELESVGNQIDHSAHVRTTIHPSGSGPTRVVRYPLRPAYQLVFSCNKCRIRTRIVRTITCFWRSCCDLGPRTDGSHTDKLRTDQVTLHGPPFGLAFWMP